MNIFNRRSNITVDAFTSNAGIYEFFSIQSANNFLPNWWKQLPPTYTTVSEFGISVDRSTLKRCDGLAELYKHGAIIPMWSDLAIRTFEDGNWAYQYSADDSPPIQTSNNQQLGSEFNNSIHMKIISPWLVREGKGIKFLQIQPYWNNIRQLSKFTLPIGTVDFKYQNSTTINLISPRVDDAFTLHAGTPVVHLIPLSENNLTVKCHLLSKDEYETIRLKCAYSFSFQGRYKKVKRHVDVQSKCPFGFK